MSVEMNIGSRNTLAIISFVFGLLAFLSTVILSNNILTGIFGLAAMIIGALALKQIKKQSEKGKGLAIIGIVLGILSIAYFLLGAVYYLFLTLFYRAISG